MATMNTTLKAIMICVICAATLMSGCISGDDSPKGFTDNPAGFEIGETRYYKVDRLATTHEGSITWDGSEYHVSGYFESSICNRRSDDFRCGTIEGTWDNCIYTEMWQNDRYKLDEVTNTFPHRLLRQMIESVTYR